MRGDALLRSAAAWLMPLVLLALLLTALAAVLGVMPPSMQRVATDGLIKLLVVVGSYIFIGNSGVLSFGHVSFMGIGAYVAAWLVIAPDTKQFMLPGRWPRAVLLHCLH
jgi:branched-chain amino acid transport system permease protein